MLQRMIDSGFALDFFSVILFHLIILCPLLCPQTKCAIFIGYFVSIIGFGFIFADVFGPVSTIKYHLKTHKYKIYIFMLFCVLFCSLEWIMIKFCVILFRLIHSLISFWLAISMPCTSSTLVKNEQISKSFPY